MNTQAFTRTARTCIAGFDGTAQRAITAWRDGSERLGGFARTRWDRAFEQSRPQLSEETQRNASRARDWFARHYVQGTALAADGAETAVQAVVQAAQAAVDRADAWQQSRA